MASRFDGATLLILGCVALVVVCVLIVGWPSAGNSARNLGAPNSTAPNSTAPYPTAPGNTATGWAVPGSTAGGWAVPGSTVSGEIATHDAPT
ncbi:MAG: hypothetical protein GXX96_18570 [Planctomycetaceae bacterium]|jgi:hypothetical protein|nr:hypothetical protein [Planctomycetaceae bacterium]